MAYSPMCKDCGTKYAQEMGLCRACQSLRVKPDTPETRRCVSCLLVAPHPRCTLAFGHVGAHEFSSGGASRVAVRSRGQDSAFLLAMWSVAGP